MTQISDYTIVKVNDEKKMVFLVDCDYGNRSVTNDAERVVADVNHDYPGYRIYYRDSMNDWGELIHENGVFKNFGLPPGETDYWIC